VTRYVWNGSKVVEKIEAAPRPELYIQSDLPAYKSPLGTGLIDGRAARREDLKRSGCREVAPDEFKPTYTNERYVEKLRRLGINVRGKD